MWLPAQGVFDIHQVAQETKVKNEKEVIEQAPKFGGRFRCDADGPTPPQELDVEPKSQTYRGLVVLQVEVVKDGSGSYAVFTEQGSSASHMTAAKVLDVIARVLGCAGQPSDAVSAHIQLRRECAPNLLKLTNSKCPDIRIRLRRHKWPKKRGTAFNNLRLRLKGICTDTPWLDCIGRDSSRRFLLPNGCEKEPTWECLSVYRQHGLSLSVYVDDIEVAWLEAQFGGRVDKINETRWSGETFSVSWSSLLPNVNA